MPDASLRRHHTLPVPHPHLRLDGVEVREAAGVELLVGRVAEGGQRQRVQVEQLWGEREGGLGGRMTDEVVDIAGRRGRIEYNKCVGNQEQGFMRPRTQEQHL